MTATIDFLKVLIISTLEKSNYLLQSLGNKEIRSFETPAEVFLLNT